MAQIATHTGPLMTDVFASERAILIQPFRHNLSSGPGGGAEWMDSRPATPEAAVAGITSALRDAATSMWADGSRFGADYPAGQQQPYNTWPLMAYHQLMSLIYDRPRASELGWWSWPVFQCNTRRWTESVCEIMEKIHDRCKNGDECWVWSARISKSISRLIEDGIIESR